MQATSTLLDDHDHRDQVRDAIRLLGRVRATLSDLLDRVPDEPSLLGDVTLKQFELESALRRAFETEDRWNDWQAKHGRTRPDRVEIDFDAIRQEVACRIERLRSCCQEG